MSEAARRKRYREEDLEFALAEHEHGAKVTELCAKCHIPDRTLRRKIANKKAGLVAKRPGPSPILGCEAEDDIYEWAIAMQREGYPVDRDALIAKAQEVFAAMFGKTRAAGTVGRGSAQIIKGTRNEISRSAVAAFFWRLARAVVEDGAGTERIYNMDETLFKQSSKTRKMTARRGSRNVWSRSVDTSFHLTLVACGFACGDILSPLFIAPGKRLNRDVLDATNISGARITTADAGFMATMTMREWLGTFAADVPTPVKRPLILVIDGAPSHMHSSIDTVAEQVGVQIVQLPPNSSHLCQPLDVAVFRGAKTALKSHINQFLISSSQTTMAKRDVVQVVSSAWLTGALERPSNIASGFREAGIWSLSLSAMNKRLENFQRNGTKKETPSPAWLVCREAVRTEILVLLPNPEQKQRRRKTVDVKSRLLTQDDLHNT